MEPKYVKLKVGNDILQKELRFDINAIAAFEEETGKSLIGMIAKLGAAQEAEGEMGILNVLSIGTIRAAVWAGLLWRPGKKKLTIEQVGNMMIGSMGALTEYLTAVMSGITESMGMDKQQEMDKAIEENFTLGESSVQQLHASHPANLLMSK